MKSLLTLLILTCAGFLSFGQHIKKLDGTVITAKVLDEKVRFLADAAQVAGLGVVVLNDNKIVYQETFGYRNQPEKLALGLHTNMYGASLSKAVFAVLVMKLVAEGVLELDKPLQQYLPKPIYEYAASGKWTEDYSSLKGDTLHQKITARMCLTHTTGFHNWRFFEPDQKLRINFIPGSRYSYSGEGLAFLQFVIEKKLGRGLEDLMKEKIFGPLGMKNSSYTWQPGFEKDYAWGHDTTGKTFEKDKDNYPRGASTLETTVADYALFTQAVMQDAVLSPASRKEMFSPQIRITSVSQFPPMRVSHTTDYDALRLSYGLGWGVLYSPAGWAAFKEGHGDGFQHYSILFPGKKTGIIIMTNSDNGESIYKELLEFAIGDVYTPWKWQGYIPYDQRK
jgi:serine-type D-Ala-D-Ala carboxypeptidase/endopeptidase